MVLKKTQKRWKLRVCLVAVQQKWVQDNHMEAVVEVSDMDK